MSCLLINGIAKGCRDNIGGIQKVYLANKDLISSIVVGEGSPQDLFMVTTITTVNELAVPAPAFYEFQPNKTSSNWSDTIAPVASNGGTMYTPSVTMVFSKNDSSKVNTVKLMGQSELVAIVKNNDGKYFLLGADTTENGGGNGLELSGGAYASGTSYADLNGWTITLSGGETHPAYEIDPVTIDSFLIVPLT